MRQAGSACARWARVAAPFVIGLMLWQTASAVEPRVAGFNELVIFDPGVHERGLAGVNFQPVDDGMEIDIAPIVHVHRYYYSGDKEFQGPIIVGGPTIVVANHPRTGERMYVDVVLPPGAPIIEHCGSAITYGFEDQRVVIHFCGREKAVVKYLPGKGVARRIQERRARIKEAHQAAVQRSALAGALKEAGEDVKKVAVGAVGVVGSTATAAVETGQKVIRMVPGVQMLQSAADQRLERLETEGIKQAARAQELAEPVFVRTIR